MDRLDNGAIFHYNTRVITWLRSSVVEQETHKLLVGSSNLPVATRNYLFSSMLNRLTEVLDRELILPA